MNYHQLIERVKTNPTFNNWIAPVALIAIVTLGIMMCSGCTPMAIAETETGAPDRVATRLADIEKELKPATKAVEATPEWKVYQDANKKLKSTKAWSKYNGLIMEKKYLLENFVKGGAK